MPAALSVGLALAGKGRNMAKCHYFEDRTADHLKLDRREFAAFDSKAKQVFCRDYLKLLIKDYGTAKRISEVTGISARGIYMIIERYGLETQYNAQKVMLKKEKRDGRSKRQRRVIETAQD